jgi:uncharacterized protein YbaR (Trm112 family)
MADRQGPPYTENMISQELLEMLRCPWDPTRTAKLAQVDDRLVCERCQLRFRIRDGFPVMIVEEAELPTGCSSLQLLPCQVGAPAARSS